MNFYYWVGYHFSRLAGRLLFRFRVIHREKMIQSGPVILAMNHQSYLDPPLAGTASDRPIYFLARRTLLDVPLLGRILPKLNVIPVNQEGVDRSAIKAVIRVLQAGNGVLVFPEGSRTLDGNLQPAELRVVGHDGRLRYSYKHAGGHQLSGNLQRQFCQWEQRHSHGQRSQRLDLCRMERRLYGHGQLHGKLGRRAVGDGNLSCANDFCTDGIKRSG